MQPEMPERRSKSAARVGLNARVEICGREPGTPAFEAESVEVSGRGMQVRTPYLPEIGAPLVLRFEHDGKEVIVEGDVAWRREGDEGGEFGVKFTALDSKSVVVLKELVGARPAGPAQKVAKAAPVEPEVPALRHGAPVKLHIEGMGAPMKARVFEGNKRRLKVGSQLEFLKLGRALELEDVSAGQRRAAHVDTVSVQVDPESQIPHLVVSIRYEGAADLTPEPTVVDDRARRRAKAKSQAAERFAEDSDLESDDEALDDEESDEEYDDDLDGAEARLKGRFALWAARTGMALKRRSEQVAHASSEAAESLAALARRKLSTAARPKESGPSKQHEARRTTRATGAVSMGPAGLQRNSALRRSVPPAKGSATGRRTAAPAAGWGFRSPAFIAVSAAGLLAVTAFWMRSDPSPEFQSKATEFVNKTQAAAPPVSAFPAPVALNTPPAAAAAQARGIVANVPMFGPTPMVTIEAAPVNPGPPPGAVDEYSLAKDQAFDDKPVPAAAVARVAQAMEPASESRAESTVFQVGRMQLPIIYRLRLDAEGTALQGEKTANGFSVLVPGRRVMENGSAISRGDNRVADVRVRNTPAGGKVTMRFNNEAPGYKVRLRNDYLEFFINSPSKTKR